VGLNPQPSPTDARTMGIRDDERSGREKLERQKDPVPFAQAAWDEGRLCFTWKLTQVHNANAEDLDDGIEQLLRVGWDLRSASLSHNQHGAETIVFAFVRP
jgi:hypothetical protein